VAEKKDQNADDPGDASMLSDEEWAQFERSFTRDSAKTATYKEPSARQRELTEKWKKERPRDTGWRTDGAPADLSAAPAGDRRTPVGYGTERRRRWRRNVAWVVLAALVTSAIIGVPRLFSSSKNGNSGSNGGSSNTPFDGTTPGVTPTSTPAGVPPASAAATSYADPDDQYFDNSPSIGWQNGAEGIVPPPAAPVGNYSAKTVGNAYTALRQMLIAADLDPAVLADGEPTALFQLVDSREGAKQEYEKSVAKPARDNNPKTYASRFNPKTTKVLGKIVKVHGSMSATLDKNGDLIVAGDYSFVYALSSADGQGVDRSLVRRAWKLDIQPADVDSGRGYWVSDWHFEISNDRCDVVDGFINPSFGGSGGVNTNKVVDPYATTAVPDPTTAPSVAASPSGSASALECDATKPV
jgi:hypothetical protein